MQKKTIAVKKPLYLFTVEVNRIAQGQRVTDSLVYRLWRMYDDIIIPDRYADMAVLCALQSVEFGCINNCRREYIWAAKRIKEVLRDCGMWNLN